MSVKDRLNEFLRSKNLRPSSFERACGLSNGFVSKVNNNITDGSLALIKAAFPDLNTNWLKTGFGQMTSEPAVELSDKDEHSNMLAMVKMMQEFVALGKKNADANLMNAEANKMNAVNLERLITIIERRLE